MAGIKNKTFVFLKNK
jgi:ankyrin repeat protein